MVREAVAKRQNDIELKIYYAGKDFGYVQKYGVVTRGTLIINSKLKFDALSKTVIEGAIDKAVKESTN